MSFYIYRDESNQWRWYLEAANNKKIASGEGFHNRQDCLDSIALVKSSSNAPIYDMSK